jgi:hypothetical protein
MSVFKSNLAEAVRYIDNDDGTVTDDYNGVMWQKGNNDGFYNWYASSGKYDQLQNPDQINICGELRLGDYTDWRVPTERELRDLRDSLAKESGGRSDNTSLPIALAGVYWTSASDGESFAIAVSFDYGTFQSYLKGQILNIRCVRSR